MYYLAASLHTSATIDQSGTAYPRVTRISRRRIAQAYEPNHGNGINIILLHYIPQFNRGMLRRGAPLLHHHGVVSMQEDCRKQTGNHTPVQCPMYANLMQSVSALTVCVLGATKTPSPAVQAAHLALSLPYALKLTSTPLGMIPVPLPVGVGHPRPSCNRVQVVAVVARRYCSWLTPCFQRRASKKNAFGQNKWDSAQWHGTGQSKNYGKNDGGELLYMHQPGRG